MRTVIASVFALGCVGLVSSQENAGAKEQLSGAQVENMVVPIALYPDPLLKNTLEVCTHPGEIAAATDFVHRPESSRGTPDAGWSAAVKALVGYPVVLNMLDAQLSWAVRLGAAYKAQPRTVMDAVNTVRQKALKAGTLVSNDHEKVTDDSGTVTIEPTGADEDWVPCYDPVEIYTPGYAWEWRRGFIAGYWWRGHHVLYHPAAHPNHPLYHPAYNPAYNATGHPDAHHSVEHHYHFHGQEAPHHAQPAPHPGTAHGGRR